MIAVILAAGLSKRLRPITIDSPKCLLEINGETMISRYLNLLDKAGVTETIIVTGFNHGAVVEEITKVKRGMKVKTIHNPDFEKKGNHPIDSFLLTRDSVDGDFLLLNSDIYFSQETIVELVKSPNSCVAIDSASEFIPGEMFVNFDEAGQVSQIAKCLDRQEKNQGKSIQVAKFIKNDKDAVYERAQEIAQDEGVYYPAQAYDTIIDQKKFFVIDMAGEFSHELDTVEDYDSLRSKVEKQN